MSVTSLTSYEYLGGKDYRNVGDCLLGVCDCLRGVCKQAEACVRKRVYVARLPLCGFGRKTSFEVISV